MAKTKTPFFSMGSQGTVGSVLTTQRRGTATMVRTKPIPTYRRTLPQLYQRWLYEDYAYLWTQQTASTRQEYASAGSRYHLTGFQYWMKYHLTKLPDIVAWYRLDEQTGGVAHDSSPSGYNGAIIGASFATGLIAGALSFDGVNDRVACPSIPFIDSFTIIAKIQVPAAWSTFYPCIFGFRSATHRIEILARHAISANRLFFTLFDGIHYAGHAGVVLPQGWHSVAAICDTSVPESRMLVNGILVRTSTAPASYSGQGATFIGGGNYLHAQFYLNGIIDNLIIFSRALDTPSVARWAERRYPA